MPCSTFSDDVGPCIPLRLNHFDADSHVRAALRSTSNVLPGLVVHILTHLFIVIPIQQLIQPVLFGSPYQLLAIQVVSNMVLIVVPLQGDVTNCQRSMMGEVSVVSTTRSVVPNCQGGV